MVFKLLVLLIGLCSAANRPACKKAGGLCQSSGTDCKGEVLIGKKYCTVKTEFCCIPLPPTDDCPESQGFFKMPAPSNKCYKYFNQNRVTFSEAQKLCINESLVLAEVDNAIDLRSYIIQKYGGIYSPNAAEDPWTWVNARGNGVMYQWQWSQVTMSKNNPLFFDILGQNVPDPVSKDYCLVLLTDYVNFGRAPISPYFYIECSFSYHILCEKN